LSASTATGLPRPSRYVLHVAADLVPDLAGGQHGIAQVDRGLVEVAVQGGDQQVGHERLLVQHGWVRGCVDDGHVASSPRPGPHARI
jgi:hypothetical protein